MRKGYVTAGFDVQIATAANPDGSVGGDWTILQSYTGQPQNGASPSQYGFALSPNQVAYGIRVVATDTSNPGTSGFMRIPEIWAFNAGYNDLALTATSVAGTGWVNTAGLRDETGQNQSYGPKGNAVTWTWATAQHLGGFLLIGDPAGSDYPTDYTVDAWNGSSWVNVETVTGNTQFTDYYAFNAPVVTDRLRLTITGDTYTGDSLARLGGMFIFEAVPEPSTVLLLGVGGLLLWRKRRS